MNQFDFLSPSSPLSPYPPSVFIHSQFDNKYVTENSKADGLTANYD